MNEEKKKVISILVGCAVVFLFMISCIVGGILKHQEKVADKEPAQKEKVQTPTDIKESTDGSEKEDGKPDKKVSEEEEIDFTAQGNQEETTPELYDPGSLKIEKVGKDVKAFIGASYDKMQPEFYNYLIINKISAKKAVLMEGTKINKKERSILMNFQLDNPAASKIQVTYSVKTDAFDFVVW